MLQANEDKWLYEQLKYIHCFCYFGENDSTSVRELLTLPLGTCIDRARLMEDAWAYMKEMFIGEIEYLSSSGEWKINSNFMRVLINGYYFLTSAVIMIFINGLVPNL